MRKRTLYWILAAALILTASSCRTQTVAVARTDKGRVMAAAKRARKTPVAVPHVGLRASYRLADVGAIGGDEYFATVSLNNRGEVAVSTGPLPPQGFIWRARHRTALVAATDMPDVVVASINDRGQAAGGVSVSGSGATSYTDGDAVIWSGGKVVLLGALPDLSDATATAINNKGQVVGNSTSDSTMQFQGGSFAITHAFLWEQGKMQDLGEGTAVAINDAGQVAGTQAWTQTQGNAFTDASHAALWSEGKWRDLGTLPGWTFSAATDISSGPVVVGYCFRDLQMEPSEAFAWRAGQMQDLGPGRALGLSAGGQVVGDSGGRAVLWWHGGFCDLNTCLRGAYKGWVLTRADKINARGQIVGTGTFHGQAHAFLLTPAQPPHLTRGVGAVPGTTIHLIAAATGSGKITLYWQGVVGATGYNILRSLASEAAKARINQTPVQTRDPDRVNGWTYTDRGLKNGQEYVYAVAAVGKRGREIARSNPSKAAPDPAAPPWDTRDTARIAAQIWANAQGLDTPMESEFGPMMPPTAQDFVAPDGKVYKDLPVLIPPSPYRYAAHPAARYDATDLGALGRPVVLARGLNESSAVVGSAQPPPGDMRSALPFVWRDGAMQALPLPASEAPYGFATGINASGTVCGFGNTTGRRQTALLWQNNALRVLPPLAGGRRSAAYGISDTGQVAGTSTDAAGQEHLVWWDSAGQPHDLGRGRLVGVNAAGQCAGTRAGHQGLLSEAVRSDKGVLQALGTLGGLFSEATAINSRGDIAGWSTVAHGSARGFLYTGGHLINLGMPPQAISSRALAVNDADVVVGSAATRTGRIALLWQQGTLANLNDMTTLPAGVVLTEATGMNNRGQICAVGQSAAGGARRAFLLTPRP